MASRLAILWVVVVALLAGCHPQGAPVELPPPRASNQGGVGAGDLIDIRVANSEELTGEYQVQEDGTIRFPWIGLVAVQGRSQGEISQEIEQQLSNGWLRDPQVQVVILARENREFTVLGQVNEPGSYPYKDGLKLLQALSIAGGMNPLAQAKKVQLTRETDNGRETFVIDVSAIIGGREDPRLAPGDVVFVPERLL
ncbi:MAG: polysaccharide export protein [Nannocystaceae bacterium]|nr:polysaccharide export protein [Nannocystaceae bacterium]